MEFPNDFGVQGQWVPQTPAKPGNAQAQKSAVAVSGLNWFDSGGVSGEMRPFGFNSEGVSQMPYRKLLAINDPAIASRMNLAPSAIARMGGGVGGSSLEMCGKIPLVQKPQSRPQSFPFLPNLNALPENNMASGVVSEGMASGASVVTPEPTGKNTRAKVQDSLPQEIINLDDEDPVEQCSSNCMESSQVANSQHQECQKNIGIKSAEELAVQHADGENQNIDLNKSPPQKLRRKKYTPKVVREGKPARARKPATPKPAKTAENSSGKRKYVRRKKDESLKEMPVKQQETPTSMLEEIVDPNSSSRKKPVRRSLEFELEKARAEALDQQSGSVPMMFRGNVLEAQGRKGYVAKESFDSSQVHARSTGQGVGFDLNNLTNHSSSDNVWMPQTPIQPPQSSRMEMMKAKWHNDYTRMLSNLSPAQQPARKEGNNLKKLARMMNCQNIPGNHNRFQQVQRQSGSNKNSEVLLQGAKRNYNVVNNGGPRVSRNCSTSSPDTCSPDSFKRRRVENGQNEPSPNASSTPVCTPSGLKTIHPMLNANKVYTLADAQRLMTLAKSQPSQMWIFNPAERKGNDSQHQDQRPISSSTKSSSYNKMDCNQPSTSEKEVGYSNGKENEIYGPQARVEAIVANQMKSKARRQRKEQDPLGNSTATNTHQTEHFMASGNNPRNELAPQGSSGLNAYLRNSPPRGYDTSRSYRASAFSFQSGALVPYRDPVEEIVQKLKHLSIQGVRKNISVQPQNALVPYAGGNGIVVPFEGPFDPIKKRKPRPKVDLDPESDRVWKLLMGKESSEGEEGTSVDKEKWWEEERRVFRGRADSFIARMHLIQGDRRFSRWKGSVLDSVIGVFLTQNVSDHLSSSAFMCLAARFPPRLKENIKSANVEGETVSEFCRRSSPGINVPEQTGDTENANHNGSLANNIGHGSIDYFKESGLDFHEIVLVKGQESPDSVLGNAVTVTSCTSDIEWDGKSPENSVVSSQNSSECPAETVSHSKMSPLSTFEADELLPRGRGSGFSSFTELLEMADGRVLSNLNTARNKTIRSAEPNGMIDWSAALQIDKGLSVPDGHAHFGSGSSMHMLSSHAHLVQHGFSSSLCSPSSHSTSTASHCYKNLLSSGAVEMEKADVTINKSNQSSLLQSEFHKRNVNERLSWPEFSLAGSPTYTRVQNEQLVTNAAPVADSFGSLSKHPAQAITSSGIGVRPIQSGKHSCSQSEVSFNGNVSNTCLDQQYGNAMMSQGERETELHVGWTHKACESEAQIQNCETYRTSSNSHNENQRNNLVAGGVANSSSRNKDYISQKVSTETNALKGQKIKVEAEKKKTYHWDNLRKQAYQNDTKKERCSDTMDSLDYEALRNADVNEISNTIRERGMNNMLADRIKDFLNRLVRDHGSTDLEWLRDVPPDKAKDYLLSIRGLGLKSVECVRLLTLHHLAFPVDTNVGRIAVRLGWVPLQPLPESLQLHLLEMYPMLETIQKYLWPRLCKLDQRTLYELHYQLITFGKVFCTKSKPNCNSCPMRGECKHFASAFASARLALPAPEEKHLVSLTTPLSSERSQVPVSNPVPLPQLEGSICSQEQTVPKNYEPIIEEPSTPEPEHFETTETDIGTSEIDIEDAFYNDPDEIPTIKLNVEEFTQNLQNYMQENNMGLQDGDMSKALVSISSELASIPMPKLKNVNRLRTEHQVYELPDSHPLLKGLDKREPDDPCPYLLAIWTPGETARSVEPPTACCNSQDTGKLCNKSTCFNCNSIREAQAQVVRGTLLIPCRTANRGSFPLNGTYFQVNEVFADHDSSRKPIEVPRNWIWNLPRRTVYFGTSIPSIFKGLTTEGIQHCFWRGFVCVRGFDRTSRAPRPLFARLHFPASKVTRNKTTTAAREDE